ncbi:ABC transporter permease subunit [Benzoatithermus flavus]|uniref:ABC transporter permease subunit n=1 Tax=Benzoatithermus flavus TaxID=3108223 RepID=A0ABU8XQK4_9PROT
MKPVLVMAFAELRVGLRNRWVAVAVGLLGTLALILASVGSAPVGTLGVDRLALTVVSLSSLSVYLLPLIALLLAYDTIVGELDRGTLHLVLTYPLSRSQLIAGKFLGHLLVLVLATVSGYGLAGGVVGWLAGADADGIAAFLRLIGSSILLGAAFLALGYLVSALSHESGTAAGLAVAVWLLFVLVYDLGLLGALVAAGEGEGIRTVFPFLLLANPADSYRLLNLTGLQGVEMLAGMGGIAKNLQFSAAVPLLVLAAWILGPLTLAGWCFSRREL